MLHLPLWQCPQHRVAEQACQPFPASSSCSGTQLQGRSDLMPITQLSSHSSSLCQPILSPSLSLAAGPTAFCHFSKVALLYFPLLHILTFLLIISSFSLLNSLLPSKLFFHIAYHWGARASSSLPTSDAVRHSLFTSHPFFSCFSINQSLLPSSQVSIKHCLNMFYLLFHYFSWSHDKVSFLFVLPHSSPFHSITPALLPLGFVPPNLSYFLRLI